MSKAREIVRSLVKARISEIDGAMNSTGFINGANFIKHGPPLDNLAQPEHPGDDKDPNKRIPPQSSSQSTEPPKSTQPSGSETSG